MVPQKAAIGLSHFLPMSQAIIDKDADHELPPEQPVQIGPDGLPITGIQAAEHEPETFEEEEDTQKSKIAQTSAIQTVMNLINSLLGVGILSVPNAMINTGIVPSLILLVFIVVLSYIATMIVITLQIEMGSDGFDDLALKLLGRWGSKILAILNIIFLLCALLAYLIIAADMILSWFSSGGIDLSSTWKRGLVILIYAICIPIALTIPRNMSFLSYFSAVTLVCVIFYVVCMIYKAFAVLLKSGINNTVVTSKLDINLFSTLSIFCLTFALPAVVSPIIKAYKPDAKARNNVQLAALIICIVLVGVSGIIGYLIYGTSAAANILNSFSNKDILITIVRIGFFLVVSFAYPLVSQGAMCSWSQMFFRDNNAALLPFKKRALVLLATNVIPLIIAIFLSSVKPALSVGGALGGCVVNFVYPGLLWFVHSKEKWYTGKNIFCLFLVLFGAVTAVISTYEAVLDAISSFSS